MAGVRKGNTLHRCLPEIKSTGSQNMMAIKLVLTNYNYGAATAHRAKGEIYLKPKEPYGSLSRMYRKLWMRVK